jgi:predicted phage baseplate assembly protein
MPAWPDGTSLGPPAPGRFGLEDPVLYAGDDAAIAARVRARRAGFTPDWRPAGSTDPGEILVTLFGGMAARVADEVRGLPDKVRVEQLRVAALSALPATPATVLLVFGVDPAAPEPVAIPEGFEVGARGAGGDLVVFETERDLVAVPGTLAAVLAVTGAAARDVTDQNTAAQPPFQPFGARPRPGDALLLGIDGQTPPGPSLAVGIGVTPPPRAPAPQSGLEQATTGDSATLVWEALDGAAWVRAELVRDETMQLGRSGVVELRLPDRFRAGVPVEVAGGKPMRWVRARLAIGAFARPPQLDFVRINAVPATAARTVEDEVLEPVPNTQGRVFRLAHAPLLAGSLELQVDDGSGFQKWRAVESLAVAEPDEPVYTVDVAAGQVTLGDGLHGRPPPAGFRNVLAHRYQYGGGSAGAVAADTVKTLLGSAPSLQTVTNPRAASGGDDAEDLAGTVRRGPEILRARGRAVLPADYEVLALRVPGARVRRIHVMPGLHPAMPGAPIPGVVGVLVVPPEDPGGSGPPVPDEQSLRAVARKLTADLAPAGVEVVAAAPSYHAVAVEAEIGPAPGSDHGVVFKAVMDALREYLDPLEGGEDGQGWPFGASVSYEAVLRRVLALKGVATVPHLSFVVDGVRLRRCEDVAIGPHDLVWPAGVLVYAVPEAP